MAPRPSPARADDGQPFKGGGGRRRRLWVWMPALALVPVAALLIGGKVERTAGPRWRWGNYDPQYAYLMNSVNVAEGRAPGVYHHPGTPVQVAGALFLMARHAVGDARGDDRGAPLREAVLADPEDALHDLSGAVRAFHAAALLALGVGAARFTGRVACALAAQGSTLLSLAAITSLHRVSPEPVVLGLSLVMGGSVLMCLSRPLPVRARFGAISGLLVGAGVATKATFAPAALVAWGVLLGPPPAGAAPAGRRRTAVIHAVTAGLAFVLLLAPLWGQLGTMFRWFKGIALADGYYGASDGHFVVNPGAYPGRLWALVTAEPVTAGVTAAGTVLAGMLLMPRFAGRLDEGGRRARALLVAVAAAQAVQFALVAKHTGARYLLPAVGLSGPALCLMFVLSRALGPALRVRRIAIGVAVAGLAAGGVAVALRADATLAAMRDLAATQLALSREADRLGSKPGQPGSGAVLVWTYWSSSPAYALFCGDHLAHMRCIDEVDRMYPDRVLYGAKSRSYRDARRVIVPREKLEGWAAEGRLYFHMKPSELPPGFRYQAAVPGGGLYRALLQRPAGAPRSGAADRRERGPAR